MSDAAPLQNLWYLAGLSRELKPAAMLRRVLFGEPLALGRTAGGAAFALRDVCPHRAAPLSAGRVTGDAVECPYHAWRFSAGDGACVSVPALPWGDERDVSGIRVARYTLAEASGLLWIWYGAGAPTLPPPDIGLTAAVTPKTMTVVDAAGPFDEAVVGLVDPAHTPTVHKQWWWREGRPRADKKKAFEPTALGFKMSAHAPSSNSLIYKALGGAPSTEIEFRLPALRLEHIRAGARHVLALTAMTPAEYGATRITHMLYWNSALFDLIRPLAQGMADDFLNQDGAILRLQNENLKRGGHRALYLGDADEPAKWYFALKRAWGPDGEGFVNPLRPATLAWRT